MNQELGGPQSMAARGEMQLKNKGKTRYSLEIAIQRFSI